TELGTNLIDDRRQRDVVQDEPRARVLDLEANLALLGLDVDRVHDAARLECPVEGDDELDGVGDEEGDAVALPYASLREGAGEPVAHRVELAVADRAVAHAQRRLFPELARHLARWLAREGRDRFFLATKTGKRTHAEARDEIRLSLRRLGVDHVDLIQLHNLVDRTEWEIAMGPDGALRAAVEARDAGLARF